MHQRARQARALFQAAGKSVDQLVLALRHADQREQVLDDLLTPALGLPVAGGVKVEVFGERELVVDAEEIGHVSDPGVHLLAFFRHIGAVDVGLAIGGLEQRCQDAKGRGLAGAVRSHETEDLSLRHLEGDMVEGGAFAVDLGQVLNSDHATPPERDSQVEEKLPSELNLKRTSPVFGLTAESGIGVEMLSW